MNKLHVWFREKRLFVKKMRPKSHLGAKLRCTELSFAELTLKETFRSPQEAPESLQEAPKRPQEAPKRLPRGPQEGSQERLQDKPVLAPQMGPQEVPKRTPQGTQKGPKIEAKTDQNR